MMSRTTYTAEQIDDAERGWRDFSTEWASWRRLASRGPGILFPPSGTRWDSWDDDYPSQRALLIRAIRETPDTLRWATLGTREPTWAKVIERLLAGRDEMRSQIPADEPSADLTPSQSVYRLSEIMTIARDSAA